MSDKSLTKKLPLLGGLLALQVVVAGLLYWQGGSQDAPRNEPLLVFDAGEIDRLEMVSEAASLSMHKAGGRWLLSDGLPVDETKLTDLLKDINGLRSGWPVATSEGAHERFNVGDENFRHRINLFAGERQTAGLIMGSAPGFRQLHVRKPGERDVYTVDLNAYAVEPQVDRWLDTALLRPEGDIESIAFNDFVVRKENDQYSGTISNDRFPQETPLTDITLTGNELSYSYEVSMGGNSMKIQVKGTINADEFNGNMTVGQFGSFPINAKKSQ